MREARWLAGPLQHCATQRSSSNRRAAWQGKVCAQSSAGASRLTSSTRRSSWSSSCTPSRWDRSRSRARKTSRLFNRLTRSPLPPHKLLRRKPLLHSVDGGPFTCASLGSGLCPLDRTDAPASCGIYYTSNTKALQRVLFRMCTAGCALGGKHGHGSLK
jgi:guanyl-specific ribonuclease Sa